MHAYQTVQSDAANASFLIMMIGSQSQTHRSPNSMAELHMNLETYQKNLWNGKILTTELSCVEINLLIHVSLMRIWSIEHYLLFQTQKLVPESYTINSTTFIMNTIAVASILYRNTIFTINHMFTSHSLNKL